MNNYAYFEKIDYKTIAVILKIKKNRKIVNVKIYYLIPYFWNK